MARVRTHRTKKGVVHRSITHGFESGGGVVQEIESEVSHGPNSGRLQGTRSRVVHDTKSGWPMGPGRVWSMGPRARWSRGPSWCSS